ncbi:hypothetical protein PHYC_02490 [Phycisphaerales bacterium]|nr:hypothetical protein PHYC_02490 [Phycisphaerales bacterium]
MSNRSVSSLFTACAALAGVGILCSMIGCATSAPAPTFSEDRFSGPAVSIDSGGRNHVAVVQAPTPGWEVTLTRVLPGFRHRAAFLTLRKPFPGVLYAQVLVTQRVATDIPSTEPIRIFARVVDHDAPADSEAAFTLAAANDTAATAGKPGTDAP